jgi:hypothetical protein
MFPSAGYNKLPDTPLEKLNKNRWHISSGSAAGAAKKNIY